MGSPFYDTPTYVAHCFLDTDGCTRSWASESIAASSSGRVLDSKRNVHNGFMDGSYEHVVFCDQTHTSNDDLAPNGLLQCCFVWLHVDRSRGTKSVHLC